MGSAVLILGFALLAGAAWLTVASLRLESLAEALLAAYLLLFGGVIGIVLALSPFGLVTRTGLLVASAAALGLAACAWQLRGRPAAPSLRAGTAVAAAALRDPVVAVLTVAVALSLAYTATLVVATPMNDFDVLWYHLTRAAMWAQDNGVHYIENANTTRLNENPPGAEILSTWAMTLEGSDRFAGSFQVLALVATMLAIARIARQLGFGHREAAFGALLFAALPIVALHAATAGNDLVFASFVVIVVAFMLPETRTSLALGGLALALSVVTKGTALFAIPLLLAVAAVLVPRRRWLPVAAVGGVAIAVGALWYVFHHFEAEGAAGDEQKAVLERATRPERIPFYIWRLAIDAVDPAGSVGRDRYAYAIAVVVLLAIAALALVRRRSRDAAIAGVAAAGLALIPIAFVSAHDIALRAYRKVLTGRVDDGVVFGDPFREPLLPTPFSSWYGPVGLIAFLAAVVLTIRAIRRGALRRGVLVLVLAPLISMLVVSSSWGYSPWHGRFLMPAVALSTSTWGIMHRTRALAWGLSAIAVVGLLLSVLHYREKPAGISVLEGTTSRSVWTADRFTVLATWTATLTPEALTIRQLDGLVEDGETVALRIREDNVSYPYFDADLERRVVFSGPVAPAEADWLVVAPGMSAEICPAGWRPVETKADGWRLYRRIGACPRESAAS